MLLKFLDDVEGGLERAKQQGEEGATKAPKVTPAMAVIDWERTVVEVSRSSDSVSDRFGMHKERLVS